MGFIRMSKADGRADDFIFRKTDRPAYGFVLPDRLDREFHETGSRPRGVGGKQDVPGGEQPVFQGA